MKLRIACVQFGPALGKVEANIAKVNMLLSLVKKDIDLLLLPELSLTGYNFASPKDIEPFLENTRTGPTYNLAAELSKRFKCTTVIGYPEKFQNITYNSAMVVDETGDVLYNYRKTHLYETDDTWGCAENPDKGFSPVTLRLGPERKPITTSIGICMDLNPYKFEAPFNEFEFSMLCRRHGSQLVLVPTAWLSPESPSIDESASEDEKLKSAREWETKLSSQSPEHANQLYEMIDYWILRFFPFLRHPYNLLPRLLNKTTVVICNRTGIETDTMYGGSSCILQFDQAKDGDSSMGHTNPSVEVMASAGWASEQVLFQEVDI